jgi:hypothetical protein
MEFNPTSNSASRIRAALSLISLLLARLGSIDRAVQIERAPVKIVDHIVYIADGMAMAYVMGVAIAKCGCEKHTIIALTES